MIELEKKEQSDGMWIAEMEDGDVAVIVDWPYYEYMGRIVQRYGQHLVHIGSPLLPGWRSAFDSQRRSLFHKGCRVRLLEKGEKLIAK